MPYATNSCYTLFINLKATTFNAWDKGRLCQPTGAPVCMWIRLPMQTDCGHIFCNDCLQEAMNNKEKMLCPIDREKYHRYIIATQLL